MTIHAYPETYLSKAQSLLGEAFDYAVNDCGIPGERFVKQFVVSPLSIRLEYGEPAVLAGKSGVELAADVIEQVTGKRPDINPTVRFSRSVEYWVGWAVAYYQWWSGRKYDAIFAAIPFDDLCQIYHPLHEADISKFADIADTRLKEFFPDTTLKRLRIACGYTQATLAERAEVSLRSIQAYEQRDKDINKASAENVYRIATTLGCTMEDLLER